MPAASGGQLESGQDAPPTSPVGAATPRRKRQVNSQPQSGRCAFPRRPWERQRRDASAKSANSLSRGDAPSTPTAGHREPQSGRCPSHDSSRSSNSLSRGDAPSRVARGSGNAATQAPSQQTASVGAVPLPRQQQVIESLSRGDAPSQVARGSGSAATQAPSQQTASVGAVPLPRRQQQVIEQPQSGRCPSHDDSSRSSRASVRAMPLPRRQRQVEACCAGLADPRRWRPGK